MISSLMLHKVVEAYFSLTERTLVPSQSRTETMAFVARPRSKAAGAEANTAMFWPVVSLTFKSRAILVVEGMIIADNLLVRIQELGPFYERI